MCAEGSHVCGGVRWWAGEVSIPIFSVKSGGLYRLSYRPVCCVVGRFEGWA